MKTTILKLCLLFLFGCNLQSNKTEIKGDTLYNIIFADGFDSDEIIFKLNNIKVTKSILVSDKSDGLTSLEFKIIKSKDKIHLINVHDNNQKYLIKNKEILLSITIDKKEYNYQLNSNLGKYIIIEFNNNRILYEQQKHMPFFD